MIHAYRGVMPKAIYRSAKNYISLAAEYRAAPGA